MSVQLRKATPQLLISKMINNKPQTNLHIQSKLLVNPAIIHNMNTLNIISYNIQNQTTPYLFKVFLNFDIILLQELKFNSPAKIKAFQEKFLKPHSYSFSRLSSASRTGILIKKNPKKIKILPFSGIHQSLNDLIIHPETTATQTEEFKDFRNRVDDCLIQIKPTKELWWIISIYAHSGEYDRQISFFTHLAQQSRISYAAITNTYLRLLADGYVIKIILGGDFNNVLDPRLDSFTGDPSSSSSQEMNLLFTLESFLREIKVKDAYRFLSPHTHHYTNKNHLNLRRLDRFYCPKGVLNRILTYSTKSYPNFGSTHTSIQLSIILDPRSTITVGPKRNIFPPKLLQTDIYLIPLVKAYHPNWDTFIFNMKSQVFKARHFLYTNKKLGLPMYSPTTLDEKNPFYAKLNNAAKASVPTTHIFTTVKNERGDDVSGSTSDILQAFYDYYNKLFRRPPSIDLSLIEDYINGTPGFPTVTNHSKFKKLNDLFTIEELETAIWKSNTKSSTGEDGIPYDAYLRTWDTAGPLLVDAANQLLLHGTLPETMKTILITMIPKREKSDSVTNYRPISLINTSLRILCSAINQRLLTVTDDLIGPHQRGFLTGRRIDENIAQFRHLADIIKKSVISQDPTINSEARNIQIQEAKNMLLILLDLTKAFDRISHQYLDLLFKHMNLGDNISRAIMTILTSQRARIYINNQKSASFPLEVGTMQGNPFLPIIFIMAVEPYLLRLTAVLQGIKINMDYMKPLPIKVSAFADDITIYLNNEHDPPNLLRETTEFEMISNSLINSQKSHILRFTDSVSPTEEIEPQHSLLKYPQKLFNDATDKYLGFPIQRLHWPNEIRKLKYLISTQNLDSLSLVQRCTAINMYFLSKLYYRDLHSPLSHDDIKELMRTYKILMYPYKISDTTLFTPVAKGGFGLLDFYLQAQGRRAKYIFDVLTVKNNWHYTVFRYKIQMLAAVQIDIYATPRTYSATEGPFTIPWYEALFGFNLQTVTGGKWIDCLSFSRHIFTEAESAYLNAWLDFLLPYRKNSYQDLRPFTFQRLNWETINKSICLINVPQLSVLTEKFLTPAHNELTPKTFRQWSKKKHSEDPWLASYRIQLITDKYPKEWEKFWQNYQKMVALSTLDLTVMHTWLLGLDLWRVHSDPSCRFCLIPFSDSSSQARQAATIRHTFLTCLVARKIWKHLFPETPRPSPFSEYVIANQEFNQGFTHWKQSLININRYLHVIRKIYNFRLSELTLDNASASSPGSPRVPALTGTRLKSLVSRYRNLTH